MYRATTLVGGKRTVLVGVAVSMFASAGVAAAATGHVPWSSAATTVDAPVDTTQPTDTVPAPIGTGDGPVVSTIALLPPDTAQPPDTVLAPTDTAPPDAAPVDTSAPGTTPPVTSPPGDTYVPLGISLACEQQGSTVTCTWSGVSIDGFSEFLLLRGDGTIGRVPYRTSDPGGGSFSDVVPAAGTYSYVVVAIDPNAKTLVHSNPVYVQIGAVG
jgi:hypothetical protein